MSMPLLTVTALPIRQDNYIWIFPTGHQEVAAVDPGDADPLIAYLEERQRHLSHILLTHHHYDHIQGVAALKNRYGAVVIGARRDVHRLPPLDSAVGEGDELTWGALCVRVWETPGHTTGHVVYLVGDALFAGDTLFSYGCGRLFEGTPSMMWKSLKRLRALPEGTRLFAAHEYTLDNLRFAATLEPDNADVRVLEAEVGRKMDRYEPSLPNTLARERRFNPFLRCDEAAFVARVGLAGQTPETVLAHLRERRNQF
jgi:hydroxyacylglutathione hydrolase